MAVNASKLEVLGGVKVCSKGLLGVIRQGLNCAGMPKKEKKGKGKKGKGAKKKNAEPVEPSKDPGWEKVRASTSSIPGALRSLVA